MRLSSWDRFSRILLILLSEVAVAVAVGAPGRPAYPQPGYPQPGYPSNRYPQKVVDQYIEDCSAGRGGPAAATCRCIINGIQATYTYAEFQILNQQISQTGQIPPRLTEIIKTCRNRPSAYQSRRR